MKKKGRGRKGGRDIDEAHARRRDEPLNPLDSLRVDIAPYDPGIPHVHERRVLILRTCEIAPFANMCLTFLIVGLK